MKKMLFNNLGAGGYESPQCETRQLRMQVPVLASNYSIPDIEEEEEEW